MATFTDTRPIHGGAFVHSIRYRREWLGSLTLSRKYDRLKTPVSRLKIASDFCSNRDSFMRPYTSRKLKSFWRADRLRVMFSDLTYNTRSKRFKRRRAV